MVLAVEELVSTRRVGEWAEELVSLGPAKRAAPVGYHRFADFFLPFLVFPSL